MIEVEVEQLHPILAVADVRATVDFYTQKLGFWCPFLEDNFAGLNLGEAQMFVKQGTPGSRDCGVYFVIGDADALFEVHRASGVEVVEPIGDREYRLRDYTVRDLDGYTVTFGQRL